MYRHILSTFLFFFLSAVQSVAQPYCDVRQFSVRDGLAANVISGIQQTDDGLMWFATWNGLCCYDGYRFTTFRDNQLGSGEVLATNRISEIEPCTKGGIWCVTYDRRLYYFSTRTSSYIDVSKLIQQQYGRNVDVRHVYPLTNGHTWVLCNNADYAFRMDDSLINHGKGIEIYSYASHQLKGRQVKRAILDGAGNEWVFTDGGPTLVGHSFDCRVPFDYVQSVGKISVLSYSKGQMAIYKSGMKRPEAVRLPQGVHCINDIVVDGSILYCATDAGVLRFDAGMKLMRTISVQHPSSPSAEARRVFVDSRHRLWVFTGADGILKVDALSGAVDWLQATLQGEASTRSGQPLFFEDCQGVVWTIPTGGTFSYYDEQQHRLVACPVRGKGDYNSLPAIESWRPDMQGNLWVTYMHDLNIINFKFRDFTSLPVGNNVEVRALFFDSQQRLWLGDSKGRVTVLSSDGSLVGYLHSDGSIGHDAQSLANRIYCIYEDRKGRYWIGTKGDGFFVCDHGRMSHYRQGDQGLNHNDIYCFGEDNHGRMWIGTHGGGLNIVEEKGGQFLFVNSSNRLRMSSSAADCQKIRRLLFMHDGTMLVSTTGGLLVTTDRFKGWSLPTCLYQHSPNDTTTLFTNDVMQTLLGSDGNVYVTTLSGGVQYVSLRHLKAGNPVFRPVKNLSILEGNAHSMVEDKNGNLWVIHEAGIEELNLRSHQIHQFGPNELGDKIEFSEALPCMDARTGRLFFGAMGSALAVSPDKVRHSSYVPNIVFISLQYSGDQDVHPILSTDQLEIPADRRNLTINFAALDFTDNSLVKYAYKLEGEDKDWIYLSSGHSASFNNLPYGHYRLLVKSTNAEGVWLDNVKALNIYAHPTFWESIWGRLFLVLIAVGVACVVLYIYNLRKNASLEHRMHQMKSQFFTNVGHKLRTPLTLIGGPVQQVLADDSLSTESRGNLEMVLRNSRDMLGLVNEMIEADGSDTFLVDDDSAPVFQQSASVASHNAPSAELTATSIRLLIVEDNDDLRRFLVSILGATYRVLEASNGREGLDVAVREIPDFIITDVMMPVMDGLSMVHEIKQNKDICHIPIIVLSAKASLNDRLDGIREGIDDYITKPFSATYLKQRIENIISQRRLLQQQFMAQYGGSKAIAPVSATTEANTASEHGRVHLPEGLEFEAPQIEDTDKVMMQKLIKFLEDNVSNSDLRIEDMANAVNLGRTVFYEKMKSITGSTPVDFLRYFRIQRAEQLIRKSKLPFSQIAYSVGFKDAKYFSTCFKREMGMTPSEYRNTKGE